VKPAELTFSLVVIVVLVLLAGYFGWQQVQTLRGLRRQPEQPDEDRHYLRRQAIRRLVCCGLMLVLAGMFVGNLLIEPTFQDMTRQQPAGEASEEQKDFARFFTAYWGAFMLVLFTLIALAGFDFWAIARFGLRHRRQLQADHRASLHAEIARLRRQRNGEGEH
jgi:uncharacterized membrane protein YjgN (DUF898 family)